MALTSRMRSVIDNNCFTRRFLRRILGSPVLWEEGASRCHDPPTGHQRSQRCAGRIPQFLAPIQRFSWFMQQETCFSSGSSEMRVGDARSWDKCSISRRSSSSVFVFRLAERSSFVTNTFAWDTGFFWRRSGQSLLKCLVRRQRKHLVLRRICSTSGAGVCELELWLKLRSRLTMFRFCRCSFQVSKVRTASSSSIGHDSSVVLLSISKFVIRASISPESTSDTDCSSRGIRGSSLTVIHDVNYLFGHTQVDRKCGAFRSVYGCPAAARTTALRSGPRRAPRNIKQPRAPFTTQSSSM